MRTIIVNNGNYKYKITVKNEFFNNVKESIENCNFYYLVRKYNLIHYMHNENGPAIINLNNGYSDYFINGKQIKRS